MRAAELREMIEFASRWVEKEFARKGAIGPMWHAVTSHGENLVLPAPRADKDTAAVLMRVVFELRDVVRCLFIDEAWIAEGGDELKAWLEQHDSLENYPGRVEVVVFAGEDSEAGTLTARRRIIRGRGKPKLGVLEIDDDIVQSEGRLVGMLPRRTATVQ